MVGAGTNTLTVSALTVGMTEAAERGLLITGAGAPVSESASQSPAT
jgi:hypothetical protein